MAFKADLEHAFPTDANTLELFARATFSSLPHRMQATIPRPNGTPWLVVRAPWVDEAQGELRWVADIPGAAPSLIAHWEDRGELAAVLQRAVRALPPHYDDPYLRARHISAECIQQR